MFEVVLLIRNDPMLTQGDWVGWLEIQGMEANSCESKRHELDDAEIQSQKRTFHKPSSF